ncbi:MAG: hypothetical protein P0Y49_00510 [Candidatus Pedobacter colombiensis]|uniref:Uncharacterized protein n=1 Tax=Candidatus Pedobacter colombiensis TaxID=3121371 RepID=A0AAJ6B7L7_9SPHI|nr:hypothetical protein [Pedobacter sp.]WEK19636.1 MAG: hypothetical protein P0Y49_00510 [Pedobacter sp.]
MNRKLSSRFSPVTFTLILFTFLSWNFNASGQRLHLKALGDTVNGFKVGLFDAERQVLNNEDEFSLLISNTDLSEEVLISGWKGRQWSGNDSTITLTRASYIPEFDVNLHVAVTYKVINKHVVKKTIQLFQPGMPLMYYTLKEKFVPAEKPAKYVSFEYDHFPGGFAHEMFPALGYVDHNNTLVGFLVDAGYKNQYTRTTRRRFSGRGGGFVGMRKLPDPQLLSVATLAEQAADHDYVQMTFGEMYNLDAGKETVVTSIPSAQSGMEMIVPLKGQQVYTISFMCKGDTALALKLFRVKNGKKTIELEHGLKYIDNFKVKENDWILFKGSILVPYIQDDSVSLFIGTPANKASKLQIKDLQIVAHQPASEPYNVLPMGEAAEKTSYLFVEPWKDHHAFMLSSQTRLAEGMGFRGSQIEKMLYGNMNMLTWINGVNDFKPFNVPNMNYSPDMYNRDSFFSIVATYNKTLNLSIWDQWAKTQTPKGGIGTIITPYMGSVEAKDNEATIEWLIWAMLNKRRFNVTPPEDKIRKAVDYVLNEFDGGKDGICRSHFSMSQVDIVDYKPKTDRLAVNQGMLAIALRTIKELGFPIEESYIQKAEQEYRKFYDPKRKHLLFDRNYPDIISLTDLEPEFYSLWLFNRPLLTDEMVINHLEQMPLLNKVANAPHPEYGTTAPICVRLTNDKQGYAYLSADYQPFAEFGAANYADGKSDGFYYNGGSWLRGEYCAYVAGLKHGWKKAPKLMENRVWAEINLNPKWPFSKEFIPTKWTTTASWWPSTQGLCWNVFLLMANEVAGLRTPDMDPDYSK